MHLHQGEMPRRGNRNRSAVISTQPWVKPTGVTHGFTIHPPLRSSNQSVDIYRGLHPRLYSRHAYSVQDTTPYIFIKEKHPEGATGTAAR